MFRPRSHGVETRLGTWVLVFALIVLWSIVIPGVVAYRDRAFYSSDLESKLPIAAGRQVQDFHAKKRLYEQIIAGIDSTIASKLSAGAPLSDIAGLQTARQSYEAASARLSPPVLLAGFEDNTTPYLYAVAYTFLAILVVSVPVNIRDTVTSPRWALLGIFFYVFYEWPTWARNMMPGSAARKTFAFVNFDMSAQSFYLQGLRTLAMFLLAGIVCQKALIWDTHIRSEVSDWSITIGDRADLVARSALVNDLFHLWQWHSLTLAAAFVPWTYLFWYQLVSVSDTRYLISGLLMHFAWFAVWYVLSIPLLDALKSWRYYRSEVLSKAATGGNTEELLLLLKDADPPSTIQLMGVSAAAMISFVLPIFNLLRSR